MPVLAPPGAQTAGEIVTQIALEVGLGQQTDPFSSQDSAIRQLIGFLNTAGRELVRMKPDGWPVLQTEWSFTTQDGDSGDYDFPDDYRWLLMRTGWDLSMVLPLNGPFDAQEWQWLQHHTLGANYWAGYRLSGAQLRIWPQPPPVGKQLTFEYASKGWLIDASDPNKAKEIATLAGDIVRLDPLLVQHYTKVKYLTAKGFPYAAAQEDFNLYFGIVSGQETGGRPVSTRLYHDPLNRYYLDDCNVPYTGLGHPID